MSKAFASGVADVLKCVDEKTPKAKPAGKATDAKTPAAAPKKK